MNQGEALPKQPGVEHIHTHTHTHSCTPVGVRHGPFQKTVDDVSHFRGQFSSEIRVRPMEGTQSCGQDLTLDSTLYLGNTHDFQLEGALVCCSAPFSEVHMVVTDRQLALLVTP